MTRKYFQAIADALRYAKPPHMDYDPNDLREAFRLWAISIDSVAAELAKMNPRFDRERFIKACGA